MRKKCLRFISILGSLALLVSCSQESDSPKYGKGGFNLSLAADCELVEVMRSESSEKNVVPDVSDFAITLCNEDNSFSKSWSTIDNMPGDEVYDVGNYTISAVYGDINQEGFDLPYYHGETNFTIRDKETTPVNVVCTQGNVKITLQYSEAFVGYFSDYTTTIRTAQGNKIESVKGESRDIYVAPGDITMQLKLTKPNGTTATFEPAKIKEATAREHYVVSFDVSESVGVAIMTVVFDNNTAVEPITIDVSDEAMVAPAPYINLEGVKSGETIMIQECNMPTGGLLGASLIARGTLAGCSLSVQSAYLQSCGFPAEVELTELTEQQASLLESMGLEIRGFDENRDKMAYVNFTNLVSKLQIYEGANSHTFSLTARDNNGKVSETATFTISNTPLSFELGNIDDVMLGSKEINIPVTFDGSDISRAQVLRHVNNSVEQLSYTVKENNNGKYVLCANVDVENKAQNIQISYAGSKKSEVQRVDVIVPEYTMSYKEYDIWSSRATISISAKESKNQELIDKYIKLYANNGSQWEEYDIEKTSRGYNIVNLTPGTTYNFNTSCLDDMSDLQQSAGLSITTEAELELPNADFESWTQWYSKEINKGGRYGKLAGWRQETQTLSSSNPDGWATVNTKTVPTSPATENTWYMTPSTLSAAGVSGNAALLRNVAWDNNGSTPPEGSWGSLSQSLSSLNAPSIANRSAGKLFLGSYSYNHSTGAETYNEGISFASRPTKLTGYYKYIAKGGDANATAKVVVEHRTTDGKVITLASRTVNLRPVAGYTHFDVALSYTNMQYKATHLRVMFASSSKASNSQATENSSISTVDDKSQAVSTGSELYIDKLSLTY